VKALTLTQPWASLVALGAKRIETRSWRSNYHGLLAIHAAASFPRWAKDTCNKPDFAKELGLDPLPTGRVIAVVTLVQCIPTDALQSNQVIGDFYLDDKERAFGDYAPGRFAWLLSHVTMLAAPIPAKGKLGLWEWNEEGLDL
jgi:activating signal cointegrator 1